MQILKDAMVLLGALLLIASVRVSRIEPVNLDLVPTVHAAEAAPVEAAAVPTEIKLPVDVPALNGQAQLDTLTVEPRVLRSCETQVFRFKDSEKRDVLAIAIETAPKPKAAPRACKIG
jgi:hypothetical protein